MEPAEGPPRGVSAAGDEGYLIEFTPVGGAVKVCAIDPVSGLEVSIVGAASASQRELTALAVRKLEYRLRKREPAAPASKIKHGKGTVV
jgi:hypothetical protein